MPGTAGSCLGARRRTLIGYGLVKSSCSRHGLNKVWAITPVSSKNFLMSPTLRQRQRTM